MRVIAGKFRSRQLRGLKGTALRPTSDKLRETLFNVLADRVAEARFADLYAGTGAVGIEAFSRGASEVLFVEKHGASVALIKKNLESLDIRERVRVIASDVVEALRKWISIGASRMPVFDLVYLDPPYADERSYQDALTLLGNSDLVAPEGVVVAEHRSSLDLADVFGKLERVRVLRQGDAALSFFKMRSKSLPETSPTE